MPSLPPLPVPPAAAAPAAASPPLASRIQSAATAIRAQIGGLVARLSPAGPAPAGPVANVGTSPFDNSVAASGVTMPSPIDGGTDASTTTNEESPLQILQMAAYDNAERGDGGDSDDEGEEVDIHFSSMRESESYERNELEQNVDPDEEGEEMTTTQPSIPTSSIPGSPPGWFPFGIPDNHTPYVPKAGTTAPATFAEVDNPGGWDDFTFQPRYTDSGRGEYKGHYTPTGARVVPEDGEGNRKAGGFTFYYNGWQADEFDKETFVRGSATKENLKPPDRKATLDVEMLKMHGMNKDRMADPLFFLQLLLPICDPKKSGIPDDKRMPYFTQVERFTNLYACGSGKGGGYGHSFKTVTEPELVHWTAIPIRHGARCGVPGRIHERWLIDEEDEYDAHIALSMTYSRYRAIKPVFKLNNNYTTPTRGQEGYDPAAKYDFIFKVTIFNMNLFTLHAELDSGADESTWGFMGECSDAGGRLKNKPVGKGTCILKCLVYVLYCNQSNIRFTYHRWPNNYVI